jgi:hypothetical protein
MVHTAAHVTYCSVGAVEYEYVTVQYLPYFNRGNTYGSGRFQGSQHYIPFRVRILGQVKGGKGEDLELSGTNRN